MKQSQRGASAEQDQALGPSRIRGANAEWGFAALSAFRGVRKAYGKLGVNDGRLGQLETYALP